MTNEQKLKTAVILLSIDLIIGLVAALVSPHFMDATYSNNLVSRILFPVIDPLIFAFFIWQIALKQN